MSNTQLANPTAKISPLAVMAARFNADPAKLLETLKATVFQSARNNEELQALVIVANSYNLNPLTKEIYAFPAKGGGIVPVVSVDGWANLANSHPQMDGMEFEWEHGDKGALISCTCTIFRKDRSHPTRITEYLSECERNTEPWKMKHRMLRHKAMSQCSRIAFGFSGIYDEDEAERIGAARATVVTNMPSTAEVSVKSQPLALEQKEETPAEAEPVATIETVIEDPESDTLRDFLLIIDEAQDASALNAQLQPSGSFKLKEHREKAKRAIQSRAKTLGLVWSEADKTFVPAG